MSVCICGHSVSRHSEGQCWVMLGDVEFRRIYCDCQSFVEDESDTAACEAEREIILDIRPRSMTTMRVKFRHLGPDSGDTMAPTPEPADYEERMTAVREDELREEAESRRVDELIDRGRGR